MGYTGLETFEDSDNASDCADMVVEDLVQSLESQLNEKGNSFNTNGPINVALFFESFILPVASNYINFDCMKILAQKTQNKLQKFRDLSNNKQWDDKVNKKEHIDAYDRMLKSLNKFLLRD